MKYKIMVKIKSLKSKASIHPKLHSHAKENF